MFRILDRYVVREVLLPFCLSLLVLTFLLEIPTIMAQGEQLIAKGVDWVTVVRILATLLPSALGITIPMALLLGILFGLGRLSADREFVALQACGVSIFRMLRPIALLAAVATAATAYVMIVLLPDQNQKFREITFNILTSSAEGDIKPRVFFQGFGPNRALYVSDIGGPGEWRDVFLADSSADETTAYFAKRGRLAIHRDSQTIELILEDGARHTTYLSKPDEYNGGPFSQLVLSIDWQTAFPRNTLTKGLNEMTIAELRAKVAENTTAGSPSVLERFTIQQKFAFPAACVVLALIGLALGVTNRTDGTLGGFVIGIAVVMIYYTLLWNSRALAVGGRLPPSVAPWIANIMFGAAGILLVLWRARFADRAIRLPLPNFRRRQKEPAAGGSAGPGHRAVRPRRVVTVIVRIPQFYLPRPRLLDLYIARQYVRVFVLSVVGLLSVFYISTFIDMADRVFRGSATTSLLLQYLYFETPRYASLIIPMAALVATLVVVGALTKSSELIVMRACGISLYRSAVPLLLFGLLLSGVLFQMQENLLAYSNRRADAILHVMRGFPAKTFGVLSRSWIVGQDGDIYHYEIFDPTRNLFDRLTLFALDREDWRLTALTYAREVVLIPSPGSDADRGFAWQGRQVWTRSFTTARPRNSKAGVVAQASWQSPAYTAYAVAKLPLEPPTYFKTDEPEAERMTYAQLSSYIEQLRTSGFHVVPYMVQLQRKVAFPFVTVIMTLLAVPFAVTTGRRGALYGVGAGIVLAIVYWTMMSVFGAVGAGGLISPMLAAWAPNILFAAAAAYSILTVRT